MSPSREPWPSVDDGYLAAVLAPRCFGRQIAPHKAFNSREFFSFFVPVFVLNPSAHLTASHFHFTGCNLKPRGSSGLSGLKTGLSIQDVQGLAPSFGICRVSLPGSRALFRSALRRPHCWERPPRCRGRPLCVPRPGATSHACVGVHSACQCWAAQQCSPRPLWLRPFRIALCDAEPTTGSLNKHLRELNWPTSTCARQAFAHDISALSQLATRPLVTTRQLAGSCADHRRHKSFPFFLQP